MLKKFQRAIAFVLTTTLAFPVHSSQLSSAMEGMFTATTVPQAFNTPSMTGVAFGSASVRFPVQNFNIISFDPPRINAGCSGIDMYMGSFAFINAEQLKTMLRAFAQGAVGFAFKAAIRSVCGSCAATLDDLQAITQRLNAMGKNTCALSKMTTDYLMNKSGLLEKAQESESLLKTARSSVDGWWAGFEKARLGGRSDRGNEYNGNLVIRALFNSQASDSFGATGASAYYGMNGDVPELIMNLVGTRIVHTGDNDSTQCTAGDSGDCVRPPDIIIGKLTFDHILKGYSESGEKVAFYRCDSKDSEMACQNPTETDFQFEGTKRYVQRMLFGDNASAYAPSSDSIMGTILHSGVGSLGTVQKQFISSSQSIPLMSIIYRTQRNRSVAQGILARSADYIAHEMAYRIVFQAIQVTERSFTKNTVTMPADLQSKITALKDDIAKKGFQKPDEILQMLGTIESLIQGMERLYPKADTSAWMKR